ncbi:MAG: uracil phosphoribosyltransferase [Thermomicrobiales bacterium]
MTDASTRFPKLRISNHPLIAHKVSLLRNETTESKDFRSLVRELTGLLIYEATVDLPTANYSIKTPMEETIGQQLSVQVGFVPILRAGIGMVDAAIDAIPGAVVYHLGMYRDEETHQPVSYYNKLPASCPTDIVIVLDPMLATGGSASDAIDALKSWGAPNIRFIGIIAAPEGVAKLNDRHHDVAVHVAALDRELNSNAFIMPGLGDAGDRLFGTH